eukprot:1157625-Pelagomonas_calceolata.AAC.1
MDKVHLSLLVLCYVLLTCVSTPVHAASTGAASASAAAAAAAAAHELSFSVGIIAGQADCWSGEQTCYCSDLRRRSDQGGHVVKRRCVPHLKGALSSRGPFLRTSLEID